MSLLQQADDFAKSTKENGKKIADLERRKNELLNENQKCFFHSLFYDFCFLCGVKIEVSELEETEKSQNMKLTEVDERIKSYENQNQKLKAYTDERGAEKEKLKAMMKTEEEEMRRKKFYPFCFLFSFFHLILNIEKERTYGQDKRNNCGIGVV